MPKDKGFKAAIIKLRTEQPDMPYTEIARIVGCSYSTVKWVCSVCSLAKGATPNKWKAKYFELREAHPDWTVYRIARELGARPGILYQLRTRYDPEYANVMALGRAAVSAGLTLKQIEAMAHARHV